MLLHECHIKQMMVTRKKEIKMLEFTIHSIIELQKDNYNFFIKYEIVTCLLVLLKPLNYTEEAT